MQIRYLPSFLDVRLVHAPRNVVAALLEDFLNRAGLESQGHGGMTTGRPLPRMAVNPRSAPRLFWEGKPKLLRYSLEEAGPNATEVKMQIGLGTNFERCLYGFMVTLALWLNIVIGVFVSMRSHLAPGGAVSFLDLFGPLCAAVAIWFVAFTWVWWRLLECSLLPSRFYHMLATEGGVQHLALSLPTSTWPHIVTLAIIAVGFLGVA